MSTAPTDLYTISMDDLRKMAEGQPLPAPDPNDPPRDEKGRFVAADPDPAAPVADADVPPPAADPIVEEREIDLGDGSGIQIFRGVGASKEDALAALADELAKAQVHATKKIRELSHPVVPPPAADPAVTAENEFLLSQRLLETPRTVIRDLLKEEFGMSPAEIKAKLAKADQVVQEQQEAAIVNQFLAANPDYDPSERNGNRLFRQLQIDNLQPTTENLQRVYNDLKTEGLIAPKAAATTTTAPRSRASGLSTRSSVAPPPPPTVDISKLSTEELRRLAGGYIYNR